MAGEPTWRDLIDMVSDAISNVDINAKRENDKLREDMTSLRNELNATRSDIMLNRNEMNALRVDMTDMRGKIEREMLESDAAQCQEIELIKQQGTIEGNRKAKIVGALVTIAAGITTIILKLLGYV